MSYRVSRSRQDFELAIGIVVSDLGPLYKTAQKHSAGPRLLGAYYVVAYAQLEIYIKSVVENSIDILNRAPPKIDRWPDLMLGYLLHKTENLAESYRRYGSDEDEGAIIKKLGGTARKISTWGGGPALPITAVASDYLAHKKYPSPKNLPQLFRRLGIERIWDIIGREGRIDGKLILTSLNDLRTNIAHEGRVPPNFSLGDFKEKILQMKHFVKALDRGIANHFCPNLVARVTWNTHIR